MGNYIDSSLRPGEQVEHEAHLSMWSLASGFMLGGLFLLCSIACLHFMVSDSVRMIGNVFSVVLLAGGIVILGQTLARYYTTELAVTNKRVISKRGWVSRTTVELLLHKVESVQVMQSALQRILGYGDIVVSAAGEENALISGINNPTAFRDMYYDAEENRSKKANNTESTKLVEEPIGV